MSDDTKKCPVTHLTTDFGAPVVTNRDSLTAGPRGPLLAQDVWLNEKHRTPGFIRPSSMAARTAATACSTRRPPDGSSGSRSGRPCATGEL